MLMLEKLISLFAPHSCLGCGVETDSLYCDACRETLLPVPSRCYRCYVTTEDFQVCARCAPDTALSVVYVATEYQGVIKELIHRIKYERAQSGTAEVADMAAPLLRFCEDALLTHLPTATKRVRMRGYDHAKLLCRYLSWKTDLPRATLLARVGQAHQVGAGRGVRLQQLQGAFRPRCLSRIQGRHIILVDDVLTTGASLESAARVLKRAGAAKVSAVVFAQA